MKRLLHCNPLLRALKYLPQKSIFILPVILLICSGSTAQNIFNFSNSSHRLSPVESPMLLAPNTWEYASSNGQPSARHECSYVEAGGKFYLIGGRGNPALNIYNPQTDSWSTGTNIPNG